MGDWKLEVFRMSLYVFFPLSIFYVANKTEYFKKRENISWLYEDYSHRAPPEVIEQNRRELNEAREKRWKAAEEKRRKMEEAELQMLEEKRKALKAS